MKHPTTGEDLKPAGIMGVEMASKILTGSNTPPDEINFMAWGEKGFTKNLADGFDITDLLTTGI